MSTVWPAMVLGGSGYVAGELLRLLSQHPSLRTHAVVSTSRAGKPVADAFAHLGPVYPELLFVSERDAVRALEQAPHWVVLCAAPHCASAALIDALLKAGESAGVRLSVVDASADFRFAHADQFADVYGQPHPAPERLEQFRCAVPEHLKTIDTPHAAQPGCFATAMLLAIVPLIEHKLSEHEFFVSAVTGSTGAGRSLRETTHHPVRHSNLFAYQPLRHRHDPEVRALALNATGQEIGLHFVPHSGPFARGIHATVFARRNCDFSTPQLTEAFKEFYAHSELVRVQSAPPRVKDVTGSNFAVLSVSADDDMLVVCCALDNLLKGAASGAVQWANRLLGRPEEEGLISAPPGWV